MKSMRQINNRVVTANVTAFVLSLCFMQPIFAADAAKVDDFLTRLAQSKDAAQAGRIESELLMEWAKSGSAAIDLLFERGLDAQEAGQIDAAIDHFSAAIDHDPAFAAAYEARASAYFALGYDGPALEDLAHTLTLEPRHFSALIGLATILEETDDPKRALAAYQKAAQIHPFIEEVNDAIARLTRKIEGQEL